MSKPTPVPPMRYLMPVATATVLIAVCPVLIVWWLRASGAVASPLLEIVLGMTLSLGASCLGCAYWERRPGSSDLLFSELMIWGFLHRWRTQRQLASALDTLGPISQTQRRVGHGPSTNDQAKPLERLVARMETRDPYLHGHSRRVARHSWMIARRMGLPRAEVARIRTAAAIHDVGKIETPKAILHKAGPLTGAEYEVIKRHPDDGARMAAVLHDSELTAMVRHHHERLDGTGYPSGLSGEQIPLGARIIAVADTFDAITSIRPYRSTCSHKNAIDILRNEAGTQLDRGVVRAFCSHYAGRRPLVLWASLAGLPERVVSWLGGSVASAASAAKVIAIAALIGGAAATTSTLAVPLVKPHQTRPHSTSTAWLQAQAVDSRPKIVSTSTRTAATPRSPHADRLRPAIARPPVHGGSPAPQPAISLAAGAVMAQDSGSGNAGAGSGQGTGSGKSEETNGKGKSEEAHGKGKSEEAHSKGKSEEAHGKGKSESPAKGKSEEAPSKGKTESPAKGKSEEAHGKSEEAAAKGKSEEAHGKK